jgi:phage-related protein
MEDAQLVLSVRFYQTSSGREPVREWLNGLTTIDRKTIGNDLKTIQFGWPLGMPLVRKLEPGLWEVRSRVADGIARVLFTIVGSIMVLLHGFVKKSQKTPVDDLALARKRLRHVLAEDEDLE